MVFHDVSELTLVLVCQIRFVRWIGVLVGILWRVVCSMDIFGGWVV